MTAPPQGQTLADVKPGDRLIEDGHRLDESVTIHTVLRVTKLYAITAGPHINHKWRLTDGIQPGDVPRFRCRRSVRKPAPGELQAIATRSRFFWVLRHLEEASKLARKDMKRPTAEDLAKAEQALALVQGLLAATAEPSTATEEE